MKLIPDAIIGIINLRLSKLYALRKNPLILLHYKDIELNQL